MKTLISLASLVAFLVLAGCGQKGDLYRTENTPPPNLEKSAYQ